MLPTYCSRFRGAIWAGLAAIFLTGCTPRQGLLAESFPTALELRDTAFFPQREYQCGPAALATLLHVSGAPVLPQELRPQVYLPRRRGSLQPELLAASRRYSRVPYVLEPEVGAVLGELAAGRPVLVLQNLGLKRFPVWHYAVVIGFDPEQNRLILRSGTKRRLSTSLPRFLASWKASGSWGVVLLRPGELPANPDAERYLLAVAALEEKGFHQAAATAYRTAVATWPKNPVAHFGLANTLVAGGSYLAAIEHYQWLLARQPNDPVVENNLALTLSAMGCPGAGLAVVEGIFGGSEIQPELKRELVATRREILDALFKAGGTETDCDIMAGGSRSSHRTYNR